jgi:hypothetical protein
MISVETILETEIFFLGKEKNIEKLENRLQKLRSIDINRFNLQTLKVIYGITH